MRKTFLLCFTTFVALYGNARADCVTRTDNPDGSYQLNYNCWWGYDYISEVKYNADGNILSEETARNDGEGSKYMTVYTYDENTGKVIKSETSTYDYSGTTLKSTGNTNYIYENGYIYKKSTTTDVNGHLLYDWDQTTNPDGSWTSVEQRYKYDGNNLLFEMKENWTSCGSGCSSGHSYDNYAYHYDNDGNLISKTSGVTYHGSWGNYDGPVVETYEYRNNKQYVYDSNHDLLKIVEEDGTYEQYDSSGKKLGKYNADGSIWVRTLKPYYTIPEAEEATKEGKSFSLSITF